MAKLSKGQFIVNEDEALSVIQSGFGKKTDAGVILHPIEAAYLCELNLLEIKDGKKKLKVADILKRHKLVKNPKIGKLPAVPEQFEIYSQLRSGGRVVRFNSHSPHYWRVYARGVGREQERAQILLRLTSSDWRATLSSLELEISVARQLRMELILAFIEKKRPTFIKVNKFNLD